MKNKFKNFIVKLYNCYASRISFGVYFDSNRGEQKPFAALMAFFVFTYLLLKYT